MGQSYSTNDPKVRNELAKLKMNVLFTDWEMGRLYQRFLDLGGSLDTSIPLDSIITIPELKFNPFRYRIARVFGERAFANNDDENSPLQQQLDHVNELAISSPLKQTREQLLLTSQDLTDYTISFDSFLKLLSAFSYRADLSMKTRLAFAIYDFDSDGYISTLDIECMLATALGPTALHSQQYRQIAFEIVSEIDIDGNGSTSEIEFSRVIQRMSDFTSRLTIDIQF